MRPTILIAARAMTCASLLSAVGHLDAAIYYWDTNGPTPGLGSSSSPVDWLTNSWSAGSNGTAATGAWPNTMIDNQDEAVFAGDDGTVNVSADVYANAIRFETNGYTITGTIGALHLTGTDPTIEVSLPNGNNTATITAPILGGNGLTLTGNTSLASGLKFLVLANNDNANPNSFTGPFVIEAGGALRIGGGISNEQIPDALDMEITGVIDFVTSGGASDGKRERVRDVAVSGAEAIFSVGNGSDFEVNSISGWDTLSGPGISVNGNTAGVPGTLSITGWSDGSGQLTLSNSRLRVNTTGAQSAIGGRILLAGDILSSGNSEVSNNNGGSTPDDNLFTHKALDFTGEAHDINVADGTLLFTSRSANHPLDVTSTDPDGTTLTKTGDGIWLWEHAAQRSFSGTNRVEAGTWRLGVSQRLADGADLEVAGGVFDMQGHDETVGTVLLESGSIIGTGGATLSASHFEVHDGTIDVALAGSPQLTKSTSGTVELNGANTYTAATTVGAGTLLLNGSHFGGAEYTVHVGGTLGGTGSTDAAVNIEGGTLAPGASVGTFSVDNAVTFETDSHFAVEIDGATSDKLVATDLDLSDSELLDVSVLSDFVATSWLIAEYSGTLSGEFDSVTPGFAVNYDTSGEIYLQYIGIPGDYNSNGVVNAADYTIWRDSLGHEVTPGTGADGTGPGGIPDGVVDSLDYQLWIDHFGEFSPVAGSVAAVALVAEPATVLLTLFPLGAIAFHRVTRDRRFSSI